MKKIILFTAALTLAVTSVHAQSAKAAGAAAAAQSEKAQVPMTDGEVRKVNKAVQELTLKHGDLPSCAVTQEVSPAITIICRFGLVSALEPDTFGSCRER